jgi:hypothetical protein
MHVGKLHNICGNLYATETAYFISPYKNDTHMVAPKIWAAFNVLKKILDVPSDIKIVIKPINSKNCRGSYNSVKKMVVIDPRATNGYNYITHTPNTIMRLIETLAHEMVHAEQYKQNRLGWNYKNSCYLWEGKNCRKSYMKRPWEIEAFRRQKSLAAMVSIEIGEILFT